MQNFIKRRLKPAATGDIPNNWPVTVKISIFLDLWKNNTKQFYLMCPARVGQALEFEKGEEIEWVIEDRNTIILRRKGENKPKIKVVDRRQVLLKPTYIDDLIPDNH